MDPLLPVHLKGVPLDSIYFPVGGRHVGCEECRADNYCGARRCHGDLAENQQVKGRIIRPCYEL
jgi:hypothetical protein